MVAQICRIITLACCCLAAFNLFDALVRRDLSAIQQAASAALSIAMVAIPFVFTRMIEGFSSLYPEKPDEQPPEDE